MVWYENINGSVEAFGAEPDILRELAERAGIQYRLVIMPFKRINIKMNMKKEGLVEQYRQMATKKK